jgi:predicted double-glycine peptidase
VVTWLLRRTDPVKVQARKGFSLLDLKHFVQARGYHAQGFSDMSLEELADLKIPAIVPIRSKGVDHFVVVRGVFGDRVVLADPAFGNMTIKARRFQEIWKQGIAFIVQPPAPGMFQQSEQARAALSRVIRPEGRTVLRSLQQSAPNTPLTNP